MAEDDARVQDLRREWAATVRLDREAPRVPRILSKATQSPFQNFGCEWTKYSRPAPPGGTPLAVTAALFRQHLGKPTSVRDIPVGCTFIDLVASQDPELLFQLGVVCRTR